MDRIETQVNNNKKTVSVTLKILLEKSKETKLP